MGTVHVIKTCAQRTQNGKIGVLCTSKTAYSTYQKKLIAQFAPDKKVYIKACPGLVESIESSNESSYESSLELFKPLYDLKRKKIDTLALGCTHFPLIIKLIQKTIGKEVLILDSGDAIARQVKKVLMKNESLKTTNKKIEGSTIFYTTANPKKFDIMTERYCGVKIKSHLIKIQ